MTEYQEPYHFKQGFHPKCPKCESVNIDISLSEHLYGPANGNYEVIYCRDCHTFLGAHPILIQNLRKGIKESEKVE
ncbi:TPA: hypothetical protein NJ811_004721 [Vibrio parahaemolyticus]|uniref:hypothetical protein n=1 Tax=Vibrio fluvialis TaxID=676 RepID=UPI00096BBE4E|nr:hypothetical protein [Vibrio fluvialis]MBY7818565.1 hypothetical protein [Vibrio fluvialis]HCG9432668.1 hypothetical protein [Vibrio parahaemolyticus]HCG9631131.1 hypothetical protein [Vibrio parahaemolyticus]HCH3558367.1 hypothetical protein [Vibrio parahaemolyticus]